MNVQGRPDLPLFLAAACFILVGCVTPTVTAPPSPKVEVAPPPVVEEHLYCMCIASCANGPPTMIDMPIEACRNPPPHCKALPIFCERGVVERVEQEKQQQLRHPPDYESSAPQPRVYEL